MSENTGQSDAVSVASACYPAVSFVAMAELSKGESGGLVPFSLGELYGPITCEHDGCPENAWHIWMTEQEMCGAMKQEYPTRFVFEKRIGRALCKQHRPAG